MEQTARLVLIFEVSAFKRKIYLTARFNDQGVAFHSFDRHPVETHQNPLRISKSLCFLLTAVDIDLKCKHKSAPHCLLTDQNNIVIKRRPKNTPRMSAVYQLLFIEANIRATVP